ncbi:hypothetical protein ACWD4G_34290 [Streptomyces sp. NPDC002643]
MTWSRVALCHVVITGDDGLMQDNGDRAATRTRVAAARFTGTVPALAPVPLTDRTGGPDDDGPRLPGSVAKPARRPVADGAEAHKSLTATAVSATLTRWHGGAPAVAVVMSETSATVPCHVTTATGLLDSAPAAC